jgi:DNA-binding MarR family transcriptional regulator
MQKHNKLIPAHIRILLHLLDYEYPGSQFDVPIELFQNGIAQKINTCHGYVSRPINNLVYQGYVQVWYGRSKLDKRNHKFYILTKEGRRYSKRIKKELSDFLITLKYPNDKSEIITFKNIIIYLEKEKTCYNINEVDICNNILEDSTLNIESLKNIREKEINDITN